MGHKLSFLVSTSFTYAPLDLVHSDVWVPTPTTSLNGYKYYIAFVHDFSCLV